MIEPSAMPEKSGLPKSMPRNGVMTSATSELTIPPNAPPMMTPTARSTTLPRAMKSLKPLII